MCDFPSVCHTRAQIEAEPLKCLKGISVPKLYLDATERKFEPEFKPSYLKAVEAEHGGVFLVGANGTRKTTLATKIMSAKMDKFASTGRVDALWTTSGEILAEIKSTYSKNSTFSEKDMMDKFSKIGMLLIDDLGAEKVTDWSLSAFYSILSSRINHMKYTIVTSNLDLGQLNEWEPRIASRLAGFQVIEMTGKDWRI